MTRVHVPVPMRFGDLDAYGHLNNTQMFRLLEEARVAAFWSTDELGGGPHGGTAVLDASPGTDTLSVIARQEIEYLVQVPYLRRPLDIQLWVSHLGGASMDICYEICSPAGAEPVTVFARALTVIVLVSAATNRPRRLIDAERAAWTPYLEEPIRFTKRR